MSLRYRRVLTPIVCAGMLIGCGSLASAPASAATMQEDQVVEIHQHDDDSKLVENIEVVVLQDDQDASPMVRGKLKKPHVIKMIQDDSDTGENVKFIVLGEDGSGKEGLLKKATGHKVLLRNLNAGSDQDQNVFVVKGDGEQEAEIEVELHRHVAKLVQGKALGNFDNKALAKQLRQIADQLEAQGKKPVSAHNIHRDIEVHSSADRKFLIEKRNLNKRVVEGFKLQSVPGKHVVIGKPGESKKMVIEVQSVTGKPHDHGDQKKVIVLGKNQNMLVEGIHVDGDHDPSELARIILDKVEAKSPKLKIEVENILQEARKQVKNAPVVVGKLLKQRNRQTLDELKQELDGLRRELDQLQSQRKDRSNRELN